MHRSVRKLFAWMPAFLLVMGTFSVGMPSDLAHAAANQTYYVDSSAGNDSNDGTSEAKAWKSLSKVSSMTFQPGDRILFKAGSAFTGRLEPKGSGTAAAPIQISTYGIGARPVLQPGNDWVEPTMTMNNYVKRNVKVNSVIKLYNQSYWEIEGLELFDPKYESIDPMNTDVYRRGIYIEAQDAGAIKHIYIRNVHIKGFKGPDTNEGKVSGGIVYHVQFNPDTPSLRQPTWFEDIVVSDSTIEHVSRTGIKFHSSWVNRTQQPDGKFPINDQRGIGPYTPSLNIHIYNNVIHDIGGDGIIIRDCKDVIVEHNTVYRAALDGTYAVGIFNWNSTNTTIQYNEVYDTQPAGDAQGIEIDALNDVTYVQYNYVHNNAGGFAMWCNTDTLPSYDGIYRYNISQNDNTSHGLIQPRASMKGAMFYNNTVYMGPGVARQFVYNYSGGPDHQVQVFNNIFYNEGTLSNLSFSTEALNYKSNVYYGFASVPNTDATAITADPKLVAPGTGGSGIGSAAGYKLQPDSPAINAGRWIANNGGKDYFGEPLYNGAPDIGASEYTGAAFPPASPPVTSEIPQSQMTVSATSFQPGQSPQLAIDSNTGTNWHTKWDLSNPLPQSITLRLGGTYQVSSLQYVPRQDGNSNGNITSYNVYASIDGTNFTKVAAGTWPNNSTRKTASFAPVSAAYIKLEATAGSGGWASASEISVFKSEQVPPSAITATASSFEPGHEPAKALDGNTATIWHTKWDGTDTARELILTLNSTVQVSSLLYLPRQDTSGAGMNNGNITSYEVYVSTDGAAYTLVASGTWANDHAEKTAAWNGISAKYVKLKAVAGTGGWASASEVKLMR